MKTTGIAKTINIVSLMALAITIGKVQTAAAVDRIMVYSTGMSDFTNSIGDGQVDQHYYVATNPINSAQTMVTYYYGAPWTPNTATSKWLSVTNCLIGTYIIRTTFSLNPQWSDATLYLKVAPDNDLTNIYLNGNPLNISGAGFEFTELSQITSGFVEGTNTLDFHIVSTGCPFGFHAQVWGYYNPFTVGMRYSAVDVTWKAVLGRLYQPQWTTNLLGPWNDLGSSVVATSTVMYVVDWIRDNPTKDYRVVDITPKKIHREPQCRSQSGTDSRTAIGP